MEKSLELDRKGLSQKELASKMGVTPQYINKHREREGKLITRIHLGDRGGFRNLFNFVISR